MDRPAFLNHSAALKAVFPKMTHFIPLITHPDLPDTIPFFP